jgi:cytochrome c-type biogenesis protein CcmH/NrfG
MQAPIDSDREQRLIDALHELTVHLQRLQRASNIAAIVCVALVIGFAIYLPIRYRSLASSRSHQLTQQTPTDSYSAVRSAMDRLDYEKSTSMLQRIAQQYPNDYYAFAYLGNIALATGKLKDAETYYARAYALFPTDDYEKPLRAVRKRLATESASPSPAQ